MAKFKPHMMYSKAGQAVKAATNAKHLELKKKGYTHSKPKKKRVNPHNPTPDTAMSR